MATTINAYSVGLGLDASEYIRNSDLSRKETAALKREINSSRTPAENYQRKFEMLTKALNAGAIEQGTFNRLLEEAHNKLLKAQGSEKKLATSTDKLADSQKKLNAEYAKAMQGIEARVNKMEQSQSRLGSVLAKNKAAFLGLAAAAAGITKVGATAVQAAANMEALTLQFELQLGSAEKAAEVINALRDFTSTTPFRLEEVAQTARGLIAAKTPAEDLQRELRILGNVAAVAGTPLFEMSQILIQARMTMQVSLGDLNRLGNRGIPVFSMLAHQLGVAENQIRSMASTGKISTEDLFAVFEKLGGEQGKYADATAKLSETFHGSFSTMQDSVTAFLDSAGKPLIPVLKSITQELTNATNAAKGGLSARQLGTDSLIGAVANLVDLTKFQTEGASDFWASVLGLPSQAEMDQMLSDQNDQMRAHVERQKRMRGRSEALPGSLDRKLIDERWAEMEEMHKKQQAAEKAVAADTEKSREEQLDAIKRQQDKQIALENRVHQMRKQHHSEIASIQQAEMQRYDRMIQRVLQDTASGPGSFSQGDDVAFLAQQENARIAKEAVLNLELEGGTEVKRDIERRKAAEEKLAEIKKLAEQAGVERRKTNDLLRQVADSAPKRIR